MVLLKNRRVCIHHVAATDMGIYPEILWNSIECNGHIRIDNLLLCPEYAFRRIRTHDLGKPHSHIRHKPAVVLEHIVWDDVELAGHCRIFRMAICRKIHSHIEKDLMSSFFLMHHLSQNSLYTKNMLLKPHV